MVLSADTQVLFAFSMSHLVPHRRKNIGYLWAIENGATQIYELDDVDVRKVDAIPSLSQLRFYTYNTTGEHHAISTYLGTWWPTSICRYLQ